MSSKERLKIYYNCLIASILLWIFGSIMVLSSSTAFAIQNTGNPFYYFERHLIFFFLGFLLFLFFQAFPYKNLKKIAKPLLLFSLFLLVAVIVLGHAVKGSKRDIGYGPLRFQPSELAKLALILYFSDFFAKREGKIVIKDFLLPLVISGFMMLLLMKEPDFGSTFLIFLYTVGYFFLAGFNLRIIGAFIAFFIPLAAAFVYFEPYRRERVIGFLNPEKNPHGLGYQIIQSLVSLGSGGIYGVGIGKGKQKLEFLPEAYKDYVYAIVGEEMGLIGTIGVLILFAVLVTGCLKICRKVKDPFGRYLASGLGLYFGCQVMLHIGVVISILPPKGTTLPFFSFGGSSIIMAMVALGVLFNIIKSLESQEEDIFLATKLY